MTQIDTLVAANEAYAASRGELPRPGRGLAVVTCMDARIDEFAVLGLEAGEAYVIRNAGARVTDDVLRSLAVACHSARVTTVLVMQHTKCAMAAKSDDELRQLTGADIEFSCIDDHPSVLRHDIEVLSTRPYLEPIEVIAGVIYDLDTGRLEEVVRWARRPDAPAS